MIVQTLMASAGASANITTVKQSPPPNIRILELDGRYGVNTNTGRWEDQSSRGHVFDIGGITYADNAFDITTGIITSDSSIDFRKLTRFSTAVWVYLTAYPTGSDNAIIGSGNYSWALRMDNNSHLNLVKYDVIDQSVTMPSNFLTGQWYHIAASLDSTETRYYVNGVKVGTYNNGDPIHTPNNTIVIGGNGNLNMNLSKAQIYNFPLSDIAVAGLFNSECAEFSLSPVDAPAFISNTNDKVAVLDPNTYSGSGNWLDTSGAGNNMVLTNNSNTIYWDEHNRGKFIGNANSELDGFNMALDLRSGVYTFMVASRYNGGKDARIFAADNNWLLGQWAENSEAYFADGSSFIYQTGTNDQKWHIHVGTQHSGKDEWQYYVNGITPMTGSNNAGTNGPLNPSVFRCGIYPNENAAGEVGVIIIWNRVLSDSEIQQAYDYYRTRYGI